jgi:hypothetical protein
MARCAATTSKPSAPRTSSATRAFIVSPTRLGFDEYDIATQILFSHHYWAVDGQLEVFSAPYRYGWPSELDRMARLAGMTLRERWSSWNGEPFTSDSTKHGPDPV